MDKPDELPRWATENIIDPVNNDPNVVEPPENKKDVGWLFDEAGIRNYLNWLGRFTYLNLKYLVDRFDFQRILDGNGSEAINQENVSFTFYAIDKTTPANYVQGVGYRASSNPTATVVSNNTLTVDSTDTDGTIVIAGGTASDIQLVVSMHEPITVV